jgi:multidrug efflux pump subunit AcrA (membrane-fusion protein)
MLARNKLMLGIGLGLFAIAATLIAACGASRPTAAVAGATTTPIVLARPSDSPVTPSATSVSSRSTGSQAVTVTKATGNLVSENQAALSFQVGGRIKEVAAKEGDKVKAGAVLAALDTGTLETQVAQAQALFTAAMTTFDKVKAGPTVDDVAIAKSNVDRAKAAMDQAQAAYDRIGGAAVPYITMMPQSLALQQATSAYQGAVGQYNLTVNHPTTSELAAAAAQVAQAQLALDQAKQTLVNAKLITPIDGTVVAISAKVGEGATVGVAAATVADLSKMQVQVSVDETSLSSIKIGQGVNLTLDALAGRKLTGRVRKIGLLGSSSTTIVSVPVTIDVDPSDAQIYPGLSATVEFQVKP